MARPGLLLVAWRGARDPQQRSDGARLHQNSMDVVAGFDPGHHRGWYFRRVSVCWYRTASTLALVQAGRLGSRSHLVGLFDFDDLICQRDACDARALVRAFACCVVLFPRGVTIRAV